MDKAQDTTDAGQRDQGNMTTYRGTGEMVPPLIVVSPTEDSDSEHYKPTTLQRYVYALREAECKKLHPHHHDTQYTDSIEEEPTGRGCEDIPMNADLIQRAAQAMAADILASKHGISVGKCQMAVKAALKSRKADPVERRVISSPLPLPLTLQAAQREEKKRRR